MFQNLGEMLVLFGRTLRALPSAWRYRRKVFEQLFEIGNASLLMACILSLFIGGVIAQMVGLRRVFLVTSGFYVIALLIVLVMYDERIGRPESRASTPPLTMRLHGQKPSRKRASGRCQAGRCRRTSVTRAFSVMISRAARRDEAPW